MRVTVLLITAVMCVVTFIVYGIDKRKAEQHRWRISEATLLSLAFFGGALGALMGMLFFRHKTRKTKFRILVPLFLVLQAALLVAFLWVTDCYHADAEAIQALQTDSAVTVTVREYGWMFDGPSGDTLLVFYPGARVEATAYAPLLREIAAAGVDVYLVNMPLRLAFFGTNRADDIFRDNAYTHRYIGGHSLGGAMAAVYASDHPDSVEGVILLAAYPSKPLSESVRCIMIYGSEDGVLNMTRIREADTYVAGTLRECVISGGNHAQFGCYGAQRGDGAAKITAEEQRKATVEHILRETGTAGYAVRYSGR